MRSVCAPAGFAGTTIGVESDAAAEAGAGAIEFGGAVAAPAAAGPPASSARETPRATVCRPLIAPPRLSRPRSPRGTRMGRHERQRDAQPSLPRHGRDAPPGLHGVADL